MFWKEFNKRDWDLFIDSWLVGDEDSSQQLLLLNFLGDIQSNWNFILVSIKLANTDEQLEKIAAGPLEHFIDKFGNDYIDKITELVDVNPQFKKILKLVWHHSEKKIWNKIENILND